MNNTAVYEVYADNYIVPIAAIPMSVDHITPESVRAELEAEYYIVIPSRKSVYRTPELTAKRKILMRMVYRGEISIDLTGTVNLGGEVGLIFYNTKPSIDDETS